MSRSQTKEILRSTGCAVVVAVGLGIAAVTGTVASPEDEIARLNRVRANLFEELVKSRAEAASARAELEAANKAREAAEAELARPKQEAASAQPANPGPSAAPKAEPQQRATIAASPAVRRLSVRSAVSGTTGSVQRTVTASTQQRLVRRSLAPRAVARQTDQAARQPAAPVARAQELPSVLRLQDPQ
jgi:pyruvate/2-oxoglutarate dehydrogenase complex dihydrolipoamide acyltransferase (E2) component